MTIDTDMPDGTAEQDEAYFDVYPISGAVDAPLSLLQAEGGLLRRGLGR